MTVAGGPGRQPHIQTQRHRDMGAVVAGEDGWLAACCNCIFTLFIDCGRVESRIYPEVRS